MNEEELEVGKTYKHVEGLRYKVDSFLLNATHYEKGQDPQEYVLYTQLDAGSFPEGTQWVREKGDFLENFILIEEQ